MDAYTSGTFVGVKEKMEECARQRKSVFGKWGGGEECNRIRRMCWSLARKKKACRLLRSWIGKNEDAKNRSKRAGNIWWREKG